MSTEQNKAIVRRLYEEVHSANNLDLIDTLYDQGFVSRMPLEGYPPTREGLKQTLLMARDAFPDYRATIDEILAEGDCVVVRWHTNGTHKGEFQGIPATGKTTSVPVITIHRIAAGKIVEEWTQWDALGMMQQLGLMPGPGQSG
jgi:steroid delta-isomerase-like uncharacterized protein